MIYRISTYVELIFYFRGKKIMSLTNKMSGSKAEPTQKFSENERSYRLGKRANYWAGIPEIGAGFDKLDESTKLNLACNLDNQAGHMARLSESQVSTSFKGFTPENMLRLVRLAMPNVVRSKIFTEFAMETARDSIKYVRPVYSKTQNGKSLVDKTDDYNRLYDDVDDGYNDINDENYRKAIYESTEDRINQELANIQTPAVADSKLTFTFVAATDEAIATAKAAVTAATDDAAKATAQTTYDYLVASKKWGDGSKFIDGYGAVYYKSEKNVIAQQDKRTKKFFLNPDYAASVSAVAVSEANGVYSITVTLTAAGAEKSDTFDPANVKAYARFDSEDDFNGDYLGEIEIKMSDYEFRPRPTSIGVTWSQLTELTLDTSFSLSAQEYLVTYSSQAIKMALDYRALKTAYAAAKTNPAAYHVEFDAAYNTTNAVASSTGTKEGYSANAQTFLSAVSTVGDNMLNDINRGGVSRLVAGPSAGTYCQLMVAFTPKGATTAEGAHQIGELSGIPLFKVPTNIIPTNEMLCVWKNPNNEADIAIAFGTLIPFFSTGVIQRKNFYKEAGLSTYGDWAIINKRYLAIIKINNLKDSTVA